MAATGNTGTYSNYNGQVVFADLSDCNGHFFSSTYSGAGSYQFCGQFIQVAEVYFYQNNIQQQIIQSTLTNSLICCTPPTPTPTPTKTLTPTPPTTICFNWVAYATSPTSFYYYANLEMGKKSNIPSIFRMRNIYN